MRMYLALSICLLFHRLGPGWADSRVKITYPSHWYQSRTEFGFPFHFKSFYMPVFADWKTSTPTLKSWAYLKNAHYEVPRYLEEGFWIPSAFKTLCVQEVRDVSYADMIRIFTSEEFNKDVVDSVRQHFTLTGRYYDQGYFTIMYFLLNLCQCIRKRYADLHCPNPCWNPTACVDMPMSTGKCHVVRSTANRARIHHRIRSKVGEAYDVAYRCQCKGQYTFNMTSNRCEMSSISCMNEANSCYNEGVCEELLPGRAGAAGMTYTCYCKPAWQGPMCEEPRNPCSLAYDLCAPFQCFRNTNNRIMGYSCACPPGTQAGSDEKPRCINTNECKVLTEPCLNGGQCVDRLPPRANIPKIAGQAHGYDCLCRYGYSGARCSHPPPILYWSRWSTWSVCSASCGVGTHVRYRKCPIPYRCPGVTVDRTQCQGPVTYCEDAQGDVEVIPYGLGSKIVQGWGIGWTPSEDRTLNDAFYWSENEDGWPSLYFSEDGFQMADILTWSKLTQLSRRWSVYQLMVYHAIVLGLLTIPLLVIFITASKVLQRLLKRAVRRTGNTTTDKG